MTSSTREEIVEVFSALDAVVDRLCKLSFDVFITPERMRALERLERVTRRLRAPQHAVINQLAAQASKSELGGTLRTALADRLRITRGEAGRRIADAEDLGARQALTGEALEPKMPATAQAQREGLIGDEHVAVIRKFFDHLPAAVELGVRIDAEVDLAGQARDFRPDQVERYAKDLMNVINTDGNYTEQERTRNRGITLGNQQYDGLSRLSGLITAELRAQIEVMLAKLAAPGACNPDDETPIVDQTPDEEAVRRDSRTTSQRQHDAFLAGIRGLLGCDTLGTHNGLPVSVIVTTTLKDLEAAAGTAVTGGGTLIPMSQLIRWAAEARHHYLAIFDDATPLALYHTKRLASPAQRLMLFGKERGCSRPGCDAPAYRSQVHHITPWRKTRRTDITDLTLACGPDNRLAEKGWTTRQNAKGETEWLPPPHLDHGQPRVNTFHRPEKLFHKDDDDPA